MQFTKPPLSFEKQADLLLSRGMSGNRSEIISKLEATSYYRLSGYWHPFRDPDPANPGNLLDSFKTGTRFEEIWNRYTFDRQLRLLVMDAIERIEVAVKTRLAYEHAHHHGPFAYAIDPASLPNCQWPQWVDFLSNIRRECDRSKDTFVKHFKSKYGDCHTCLPVWMVIEIMTFGSMLTFYRACTPKIRQLVAAPFKVHDTVFESWLLALNTVRNICAHHGRLWNRELGTKPKIPDKDPAWAGVGNDRVFGILSICKWTMHHIAPQSGWAKRLRVLLTDYQTVPLVSMGFFATWDQSPIWK